MHESKPEIVCTICGKALTLLPTDTTTDEQGQPVHPECYLQQLSRKKSVPPSAAA